MKAPKKLKDGLLIAFEGMDGAGKSTQLKLVKNELEKAGWPVYTAHNLGGTPIGEKLRDVILSATPRPAETTLYASIAIQEALVEELNHQRATGKIILLDRCPISLVAYQMYGSGLPEELVWPYVDRGMHALHPELVLMYTADLEAALERARQQNGGKGDYFESKSKKYFEQVLAGYEAAAERYQMTMIDARRSITAVHEDTMRLVQETLDGKSQ